MTAHARFKNEFTEDEKYNDLMTWVKLLIFRFSIVSVLSSPDVDLL